MSSTFPNIPGYEVEAELGRGGMGVVYRVRSQSTGAILALKMLLSRREVGYLDLARFRIEAEALACLNHPNIVKIRGVGVVSRHPYFVLEYAERGTLKQLARRVPQPARWAAELVGTLARAVQHAHGRGMLHRDLKPANVLIMADGTPKISDFGLVKFAAPIAKVSASCCTFSVSALDASLQHFAAEFAAQYSPVTAESEDELTRQVWDQCAKRTGVLADETRLKSVREFLTEAKRQTATSPHLDDLTQTGTVMGSPIYMAPEQAMGQLERIGPATDVYALGGMLYELLTGDPPITSKGGTPLLAQLVSETPQAPSRINPLVPVELDAICLKCLEKESQRRYRGAGELADELHRFLEATPYDTDATSQPGGRSEKKASAIPADESRRTRSWWPFGRRG